MQWVQVYDPLGSAVWSPLAAGLPIVVLLGLLVCGRVGAAGGAGRAGRRAGGGHRRLRHARLGRPGRGGLRRLLRTAAHRLDRADRRLPLPPDGAHRASSRSSSTR